MKRENCVIWGIGTIGSSPVLKDMLEQNYNVAAYCDNHVDGKAELNGRTVVSAGDMKSYVCSHEIVAVLIAVSDREASKSICAQIEKEISDSLKILDLYCEEMDRIESAYLANRFERLQFRYQVDFEKQSEMWVENLMGEVVFWLNECEQKRDLIDSYIQNRDFLTYSSVYKTFSERLSDGDIILDIGSGITSKFGSRTEGGNILHICAVDPLAYYFNQFLSADVSTEKKCHFGLFEMIANFYEEESADGIIINNALDHCIDPFKAIVECLYVLKQNKYLAMWHRRAEAVYEKYTGLHRWNVDYDDKDNLIIWNENNAINLTEELCELADIKVWHTKDDVLREKQRVYVEIRKKQVFDLELFFDIREERRNLAKLLERLMQYYAENSTEEIQKRIWALQKSQ